MIIFIASVAIATGVATVASGNVDIITSGIKEKGKVTAMMLRTDIKIVHVTPGGDNTSIYVLNTGSTVLNPNSTIAFIDGALVQNPFITILNRSTNVANDYWDPQEVIMINATPVGVGKHSAKVSVGGVVEEALFDK
jgi:archaellum component FlaG (FlaF/FlaG flagellin family)